MGLAAAVECHGDI
ncbi:hypothetical protein YPPY03_4571, partial [Yersinia pestis PY-03]